MSRLNSQTDRCAAVKTNGCRCKGAALQRKAFCYFHHNQHQRALQQAKAPKLPALEKGAPRPFTFEIPLLEDADAVQVAVSQVASALAANQLDPRRASALLYALQIASQNLRSTDLTFAMEKAVTHYVLSKDGAVIADCEPTDEPSFEMDDDEEEESDEEDDEQARRQRSRLELCELLYGKPDAAPPDKASATPPDHEKGQP